MGYTSEVTLALSSKVIADSLLTKNFPELLNDFDSTDEKDDKGQLVARYYNISSIKWYAGQSGYLDVQEIIDFLNPLDNEDYGFVRVGEDMGDVEEMGNPCDYDIYTSTYIECPVDFN